MMNSYQLACCIVSLFLNTILTFLIILKSPKTLGVYRYLMLYISIYEGVYSVLDVVAEPVVHSYNGCFVVFRYNGDSIFDRSSSFILVCTYCGFFGFSLAVFGVHFVYRYGAVESSFHDKYLSGKKIIFLFIMPIWYFIWWAGMCIIWLRYSDVTDRYMRTTIMENYGYNVEDTSSMCVLYHPTDENGISHPDWHVFGVLNFFWFMIFSSMFCVFYFGIRCYIKIKTTLAASRTVSRVTKNLQQQLFQALVVQTLIPLVLMYLPVSILFTLPTMNVNFGFNTTFVGYTIATYPAIDPLPNMLIIRNYRSSIKAFFGYTILNPIRRVTNSMSTNSTSINPVTIETYERTTAMPP